MTIAGWIIAMPIRQVPTIAKDAALKSQRFHKTPREKNYCAIHAPRNPTEAPMSEQLREKIKYEHAVQTRPMG